VQLETCFQVYQVVTDCGNDMIFSKIFEDNFLAIKLASQVVRVIVEAAWPRTVSNAFEYRLGNFFSV
jgi:hypothetical protein